MTRKVLGKSWTVRFEIKPFRTRPGWSNVLHATTGGNNGVYGYRTPGVWMISNTRRLHICSAVNGKSQLLLEFSKPPSKQVHLGYDPTDYEIWT